MVLAFVSHVPGKVAKRIVARRQAEVIAAHARAPGSARANLHPHARTRTRTRVRGAVHAWMQIEAARKSSAAARTKPTAITSASADAQFS